MNHTNIMNLENDFFGENFEEIVEKFIIFLEF